MKKLIHRHSIVLAALLQIFPIARTVCLVPSASSTFAIIFRWVVGSAIALESVDAVSGASVFVDSPTPVAATAGQPFVYYVTVTGNIGSDPGAIVSAAPLPAGLSCTTVEYAPGGNVRAVWGVISGTNSTPGTNTILLSASYTGATSATKLISLITYAASSPTTFSTQPVSQTFTNQQNITLTAAVTGTGPFIYQWYKGDTNIYNHIPWATNASYAFMAITNSSTSNPLIQNTAGTYLCKVTGAGGMIVSSNAVLSVSSGSGGMPPSISMQPVGVTNVAGSLISLSVGASGSGPFSYQWRVGAGNLPGATNSTHNIPNVHLSDAGNYSVIVGNTSGSVTSAPATLAVTVPPAPPITTSGTSGNYFIFTFTPVVGLTNVIQTNGSLAGGTWSALTQIPPPPTASSLSVTDTVAGPARLYRVSVSP